MDSKLLRVSIDLPEWMGEAVGSASVEWPDDLVRMDLVLALARRNVEEATGGPFAAAVFESASGALVAAGLNVVVPSGVSIAHAEIVAIAIACRAVGSYDLGAPGLPAMELVTTTEPCAMCFGAVPWSGVRRLVCGARDEDATAVGFDEGAKPVSWVAALESRGIEVVRDVRRSEGAELLADYASAGGVIYNGRRGD
jgi:tRNA(Arg) A34 adenosine deaminase TadA